MRAVTSKFSSLSTGLRNSDFSKKLLGLLTGTVISQAVPLALSPVFSRIYTREEFGTFAIFMAASSLLSVIATGRYSLAIMIEDDEDKRSHLFWGSVLIATLFSTLVFIVALCLQLVFRNDFLQNTFNCFSVAVAVFLFGTNQLLGYWFNKVNQLQMVSKSKVAQGVFTGLCTITLGVFRVSIFNGLIWGYSLGLLASNLYFWFSLQRQFQNFTFSLKKLVQVLKQHKEYPLYGAPGALMDSGALQLPTLVLSFLFDKVITGYWGFTVRLIQVPASLISFSLSQVLFQRFAQAANRERLTKDILKIAKGLLLFFLPFALILVLWGPQIFAFFFGRNWFTAGEYSRILVVSFALRFVVTPISIVFSALNKVKLGSAWQAAYFISTIVWLTAVAFLHAGIYTFLIVYTLNEIVLYSFYFYLIMRTLKKY